MAPFEYISVLLAIVISIALTHMLTGIAQMIHHGVRRFSIPLVQWIAFCLFLCVDFWFYIWRLNEQLVWTLAYVSQLLLQASLIFIVTHLIVPTATSDAPIDMTAFFERTRKRFMAVALLLALSNQALNLTLPGFGSLHMSILILAWIVLLVIGWVSASHRVHLILSGLNVLITIHYAWVFVPAL